MSLSSRRWVPALAAVLAFWGHGVSGEGEDFMIELADEVLANKQLPLPIPWEIVKFTPTYRDTGYLGEHNVGSWAQTKVQVGSLQTGREAEGYPAWVLIARVLKKEDLTPSEPPADHRYTGKGGEEIRHLGGMMNPDSATTVWGWQRQKWGDTMEWLDYWAGRSPNKLVVMHSSGDVLYGGCDENTLIYKFNQVVAASGVGAKIVVAAELSPYPADLGWAYGRSGFSDGRMADTLAGMAVPAGWVSAYADCTNSTLGPCTSPPTYQFANSGFIMGQVDAIKDMVTRLSSSVDTGCQNRAVSEYFMANPDKVTLDYSGALSMSLHNMKQNSLPVQVSMFDGKPRLENKHTGNAVCFVHGNGNGFAALKGLAAELKAR